jgi:dimethylamine/trimethylamine dehydrogenase
MKIAKGRSEDIRECIGCNICLSCENSFVPIRCTQNPTMMEEGRNLWHPEIMAPKASEDAVLIIGGGPAGLEAALSLGRRGHAVTLAEAREVMGGRVTLEAGLPGLQTWARVRDYRLGQMAKLANVALYPASRMAVEDVRGFGASRVVIATGATWRTQPMGRDGGRVALAGPVLTPDDIMAGVRPAGRVVVHDSEGGYIGSLMAEALALSGAEVTFTTPALTHSGFLALTLEQTRVLRRLTALGVRLVARQDLAGFDGGVVRLVSVLDGAGLEIAADHLVLVADRVPDDALALALLAEQGALRVAGITSVDRIGDCLAPGLIAHAVYAGHRLARGF